MSGTVGQGDRTIETTRIIRHTAPVIGAERLLAHRTKTIYFTPSHVSVRVRQQDSVPLSVERSSFAGSTRAANRALRSSPGRWRSPMA